MLISPLIDPFALHNVVDDTSPQLGGNLDGQSYDFSTAGTITVKGMLLSNYSGYSIIKAADNDGLALESDEGAKRIYFMNGGDIRLNPEGGDVIVIGNLSTANGTISAEQLTSTDDAYIANKLGIGTSTPDTGLHVKDAYVTNKGQLFIEATTNNHAYIVLAAPTSGKQCGFIFNCNGITTQRWKFVYYNSNDSFSIHSYTYGGSVMNCEADGDVKFPGSPDTTIAAGTAFDLYMDGDGYIGPNPSSRKYKTNITDLDGSERIYTLRPVRYDAKDGSGTNLMGLIAEEAAEVIPELISYKRVPVRKRIFDEISGKEIDAIDHYEITDVPETVNYSRLIVPILKAIQQLKARIDNLEK